MKDAPVKQTVMTSIPLTTVIPENSPAPQTLTITPAAQQIQKIPRTSPKTGDDTDITIWVILFAAAGGITGVVWYFWKKKHKSKHNH